MTQQCRGQRNITILILFSFRPLISCQCLPWQTTRQPLMQTWGPISQGAENRWGEWIWDANRTCPLQMMTVRDVKGKSLFCGPMLVIRDWQIFDHYSRNERLLGAEHLLIITPSESEEWTSLSKSRVWVVTIRIHVYVLRTLGQGW